MIVKLREVELLCSQGNTIAGAARQAGMTEQTFYRWRKKYGGMNTADAKRMKELEKENARLKRLVADLSLDNCVTMWPSLRRNAGANERSLLTHWLVQRLRADQYVNHSLRDICQALT